MGPPRGELSRETERADKGVAHSPLLRSHTHATQRGQRMINLENRSHMRHGVCARFSTLLPSQTVRGYFLRLGTEQVRSPVQSGVAGGHAKWFRALPAEAPPRRRSVTECRPMTPGAGPSAETECEANARAPQARHSSATAC